MFTGSYVSSIYGRLKDVYHWAASQLSARLLNWLKNNLFGMEDDQQHKSFHILGAT